MPFVISSDLKRLGQLVKYYQNKVVTHLDNFWNLNPKWRFRDALSYKYTFHEVLIPFARVVECFIDLTRMSILAKVQSHFKSNIRPYLRSPS